MNDLDTLRPEVQAAMRTMDGQAGGNRDDAYDVIEAELLRLQSTESRANEWQLRAEKAEAELLQLADDCARLVDCINAQPPTRRSLIDRAERAEAELAALKARIANSPIVEIANYGDPFIVLPDHLTVPDSLKGKRVRLVVEE